MSRHPRPLLTPYDEEVVCIVFEFEFGTTGQDLAKVYLNPIGDPKKLIPVATFTGGFTFDRLQFKVGHRPGASLIVDEVRLGRNWEDVL
ncbi:hypothetical protein [Pelagicoccus mobilis]|uniref:Uncharacterized protein n=1 Tax=Pelagicoccus mobilis TaxID=415221 RepID=A0A934VU91_9BACT|nr:hypothetical protein [Pelagicoccus mobilis]MBK1880508.1 hypothetical protein [Pelagicoccus mobilis]